MNDRVLWVLTLVFSVTSETLTVSNVYNSAGNIGVNLIVFAVTLILTMYSSYKLISSGSKTN